MEGLRQRGNSYQALVQCKGHNGEKIKKAKAFRISDYNSSLECAAAAQKWRKNAITKIKKGLWTEEDNVGYTAGITVQQAYEEMKANIWNGSTTKQSSGNTYANHFKSFLKYTGPATLVKDVGSYKYLLGFRSAYLAQEIEGIRKGVKPSTLNRVWTAVFAFLQYCRNMGYLDSSDPLPALKDLRVKEMNQEKRAITKDEAVQILHKCRGYPNEMFRLVYADIIEFCMNTGFRMNEALSMKKKHYRVIDGIPYAVVTKDRAKSAKEREVICTNRAVQILDFHCKDINNEGYVFRTKEGRPVTVAALRHCFDKMRMMLGLGPEVTFHSTRHSAITNMEREFGLSAFQIMRMVGHNNISTTQRYMSTPPDDDHNIHQRMAEKQLPLRLVGGSRA